MSGDAIENELTLSYDELRELPSRTAPRILECFGNGRTVNREQLGYEVEGGNWGFSAFSQGEWDYVPIREILDRVQPTSEAVQLLFWSGVDGPDTGRPIAMEAVLERPDDIGLAFGLNGLIPLPADHGGPVRALVPGWGGAASVKWLTEIRIASHRFWTRMHTREEALIGEQYPREEFDENADEFLGAAPEDIQGEGGTWQNTKSFLAFPYTYEVSEPPGRYILAQGEVPKLPAGQHTMRGYANSPVGIAKVEYSVDDGNTWQEATLVEPTDLPYSRVRFEFPWEATPGIARARHARDRQGGKRAAGARSAQPARNPLQRDPQVPGRGHVALRRHSFPARPGRSRLAAACGLLALILLTSAACGGGDDGATAQTQEEQVAAGQDVYAAECAKCHGEQGEGGTGPVLIGGSRRIASYGDTDRLYDYVSRTMPFDDAGSLSEQEYWDSIAYLLDANELLPAEAVLGPDSETITLER